MSAPSSKLTFFRQSGWLVFATVAGGVLMFAVHKAAGKMDKAEYGLFGTLLQALNLMTIVAMGLQTVVMRQTVAASTESQQREVNRAVRVLLGGTLAATLAVALGALVFQQDLLASLKISNPAALWLTVAWVLWVLWLFIFVGVMQGRQNFLWMGWCKILEGVLRLVAVGVIVLWLGGQAAGAATGVLIALAGTAAIGAWQTRAIWLGPGEPVRWGDWIRRVLPLIFGPGAVLFMMSLDMIVVRKFFPQEDTGYYAAAGMIGRAVMFLTAPMTAVMFPKIVASAARSEKSNAMMLALGATALLGAGAGLFCTFFPSLPLRVVFDPTYLKVATPLVPWFGWCMLPLTLSTVLVNNLVAREIYRAVPWLWLVALGYGVALLRFHGSLLQVVQILGGFGLLLVAVALWFTMRAKPLPPAA